MTNQFQADFKPFDLSLAHQALFSVADASGIHMVCREGSLWITLDNDTRDVVLNAGESFVTTEHRRALIYAMEPSSLSLTATAFAPAARPAGRPQAAPSAMLVLALQPV